MSSILPKLTLVLATAALLGACSQKEMSKTESEMASPFNLVDSCDKNQDQMVDTEEYNDCFADADRDKDGNISQAEAGDFGGHHGGRR